MKNIFEDEYKAKGSAKVINIKSTATNKVSADIIYEIDTTDVQKMHFNFSKRNKLTAFYIKPDKLQYPKPTVATNISETNLKSRIDSLVQLKRTVGKFNGCVLAIDNGKVIYKNCVGHANYENKTLLTDSSLFELASCSKQFTAMAIMILAERGKLNYTDNIQKYIPELPYENITVENLLTHTSGLPDYLEMLNKHWDKKKFATNQDIVSCFKKYKPKKYFKPDKEFQYSNTGYAMLSIIIEKVSGMSYADFLDKIFFSP